jgi:hypothetical protein
MCFRRPPANPFRQPQQRRNGDYGQPFVCGPSRNCSCFVFRAFCTTPKSSPSRDAVIDYEIRPAARRQPRIHLSHRTQNQPFRPPALTPAASGKRPLLQPPRLANRDDSNDHQPQLPHILTPAAHSARHWLHLIRPMTTEEAISRTNGHR